MDDKEIQLTLTEEELECLDNALEQRRAYVNMRLSEKGGTKESYVYLNEEMHLILGISIKMENAVINDDEN